MRGDNGKGDKGVFQETIEAEIIRNHANNKPD
ncbi:Uncharacterised protein [Serratia marcescens]|nr:hypothetical protein SCH909_2414 [Serratia marcescens]CUY27621.1 Uncharacterised protein [Serratia marcescens]CUY41717.1 Uncharacterised protein [Serratia marcescens]CUY53574.1 Uncharacterised protein [Serratia marcescens]CUY65122.1 Uncharacterised protein [Serratia marcescens]